MHACTFNLHRIVHICIIYFCKNIKLKEIIWIIQSRTSKYQNYIYQIIQLFGVIWILLSESKCILAQLHARFLLQILKSTLLFQEQLLPIFQNKFSHLSSKVEFRLFWYLVKLYFAHVVELIPSLKKHVLFSGTKNVPSKANKKMQGNLKKMS